MVFEIQYGTSIIKYKVNRKARKTLAIHVFPDGKVVADAPKTASDKAIKSKIEKRASWILKQQQQFSNYPTPLPMRQYVSGEGYRYLGRQYRLKVVTGSKTNVKLPRGQLVVEVSGKPLANKVQQALESWQLGRARNIFDDMLKKLRPKAKALSLPEHKSLILRTMKTRWGSCAKSGNITLNPELLAAPRECIEYVVAHELCHLVVANHTKRFYAKLDEFVPKWRVLRDRLNMTVELKAI